MTLLNLLKGRGLSVLLLLVACAGDQPRDPEEFKVALITPGSIADAAWNSGAYAGLNRIRDSLDVPISHIEARTPADQEEALRTYAAQGYAVVFGHGFEFQDPAERVSADYPNTVFVITSGQRVRGNVVPLIFRFSEATYLAGIVAGALTKSGMIGFVGGIELPPVKEGYEAWVAGARAMRPSVESRVTYLNNFDDAVAGREAALALMSVGADMLHHNADAAGIGVFQASKEKPGVYVFGANADQSALAPDRVIGSAVIDLPRAFLAIAQEIFEGDFEPRVESFGLGSGVVRFAENPALVDLVPDSVRVRVAVARDSIIALARQ